ncbi:hypothetical protein BVI434_410115 [Burkholderia vietnamiensis]|nr:hypothetical protein BVI434_410115 [Burkholderia vietnamiensis]
MSVGSRDYTEYVINYICVSYSDMWPGSVVREGSLSGYMSRLSSAYTRSGCRNTT